MTGLAISYIPPRTAYGPWGNRYWVTERTLAVNLAQRALAYEEDGGNEIDKAWSFFLDGDDQVHPGDGSIYGFWMKEFRKLNEEQRRNVDRIARTLYATTDVNAMDDGQRS